MFGHLGPGESYGSRSSTCEGTSEQILVRLTRPYSYRLLRVPAEDLAHIGPGQARLACERPRNGPRSASTPSRVRGAT
jgi:hypothetical protein